MKELNKQQISHVNGGTYDDSAPEYGSSAEDMVKSAVIAVISWLLS